MKTKMIDGVEHVWNPVANDLSSEMTIQPNGTMTYAKQGAWVVLMGETQKTLRSWSK